MTIPVLAGIVFGLFFITSCAQLGLTGSDSTSAITSTSTPEEINRELARVNERLSENPSDSVLQREKAVLLYTLAQNTDDPLLRKPYYRNLRELEESNEQQGIQTHAGVERILNRAWSTEQGAGVELLQVNRNGATSEAVDLDRIRTHFENAILLQPDSLSTYNLLANTHYLSGDLTSAIEVLNQALDVPGSDSPDIRERLAYLHLESGNIEQSILIYRDLTESYPEEEHLRHGLANALMLSNDHDEAIAILTDLAEEYETRYEYREALAVQLYYAFNTDVEELQENQNQESDDAPSEEQLSELVDRAARFDDLISGLEENLPLTEEQLYRNALIYLNSSESFYDLSLITDESRREGLQSLQSEFLQKAAPLLEKLVEDNPQNRDYARSLYNVYRDLGMNDEADALERSYNL
ncbi:MAG: tetratricopeptide repeat protein [Balneolaceae bacterium]|nr:tetratricopeptide repeat protein [Balneolaceae bacterium]